MNRQQLRIIDHHVHCFGRGYGCLLGNFTLAACCIAKPVGRGEQAASDQNDDYANKF
jgi:hypothetical protein